MAEKRKRTRKARKRVAKEDRKNMRLWAEGARETVLRPHIEGYADALERGWRAERDYLQEVCNEFHGRIDWRLADHEEPELPLKDFNPLETVQAEDLDPEVEKAQRSRMSAVNSRIQRWLKYRVRRLRKGFQSKLDPLKDPWAILVAQLSGVKTPPKARQAYQQFMHEDYDEKVAPLVVDEWAAKSSDGSNVQTSKGPNASFRALVARRVFSELTQSERDRYAERAKAEASEARATYEAAMKAPPSKSPEEREKCITTVGKFLGPIMKGIFERTGLHCCFLMGGPMPKFGGELRTIYASYGRNKSTAGGVYFPEWAGPRFNFVTDLMKEYLTTAFTPQDRAECALPDALAGAKYTLLPDNKDDSDEQTSDSESDVDSNRDSDDTESDTRPAKRRRGPNAKGKGKALSQDEIEKDAGDTGDEDAAAPDNDAMALSWKLGDPDAAASGAAATPPPSTAPVAAAPGDSRTGPEGAVTTPTLIPPASPSGASSGTTPVPPAPGSVTLPLPDDTPEWLRVALSYLTARDLGCHYTSLLQALVRLEESVGFEKDKHVSLPRSTVRPDEVSVWIRGARGVKMKALPKVVKLEAYATQWWKWWDELQPAWRQRGEDGKWVVGGGYGTDFGKLDCSGPNGTICIVAALYFWGSSTSHTSESRAIWEGAVQDVAWMLEGVDTLFE
ncbi:hypothetical protein DFH06DRAFT_1004174 [Mycena polygramma]|nr:hypothetical protein DFH06DRAFT_1004174 [Mycena polygramma]